VLGVHTTSPATSTVKQVAQTRSCDKFSPYKCRLECCAAESSVQLSVDRCLSHFSRKLDEKKRASAHNTFRSLQSGGSRASRPQSEAVLSGNSIEVDYAASRQ
jgi:hypothetical protein